MIIDRSFKSGLYGASMNLFFMVECLHQLQKKLSRLKNNSPLFGNKKYQVWESNTKGSIQPF